MYGYTRVHLDSFPETDYRLTGDKYFHYWDTHKNDYGVPYFPNVTSGWDPTPRVPADKPYDGKSPYPNTPVLWDNSPARFKLALEEARTRARSLPPGQRIVTIYAWNEWTEGGKPRARQCHRDVLPTGDSRCVRVPTVIYEVGLRDPRDRNQWLLYRAPDGMGDIPLELEEELNQDRVAGLSRMQTIFMPRCRLLSAKIICKGRRAVVGKITLE